MRLLLILFFVIYGAQVAAEDGKVEDLFKLMEGDSVTDDKILEILLKDLKPKVAEPDFIGTKALELIMKAEQNGKILHERSTDDFTVITFILDNKYISCFLQKKHQFCNDFTGFKPSDKP